MSYNGPGQPPQPYPQQYPGYVDAGYPQYQYAPTGAPYQPPPPQREPGMGSKKLVAIALVVIIVLGVGGCGILAYLGGTTFSGYHYDSRSVTMDIECQSCGKGNGYTGVYEWSFHWATGSRAKDLEGNGKKLEIIDLGTDECEKFTLSGMKNGDGGTLKVTLTFKNQGMNDTLYLKGETTFLSVDTTC